MSTHGSEPTTDSGLPGGPTGVRDLGSGPTRLWRAIRRNIARRTAIATLAGVIAGAGGFGWAWWGTPEPVEDPRHQSQIPDDIFEDLPVALTAHTAPVRATFFSIHTVVRTTAANGGAQALDSLLTQVMSTPGPADSMKRYVCTYIMEMGLFDVLPSMITGLVPGHSNGEARRAILTCVITLATRDAGRVPASVKAGLQACAAGGYETDPANVQLLSAAIQRLP